MQESMQRDFAEFFAGDRKQREVIYKFFESDTMRQYLKGPDGIAFFQTTIDIAAKAGAPMDEVRKRIIPLLDQEQYDAHIKRLMDKFVSGGGLESALDKRLEQMKAEVETKRQRMRESIAILEREKEARKNWFQRLFS